MMSNLHVEYLAHYRVRELLCEAEHDRLVDLATTGRGRPIRSKLADWLFALARRVEGTQSGSLVHSRA